MDENSFYLMPQTHVQNSYMLAYPWLAKLKKTLIINIYILFYGHPFTQSILIISI